LPRCSSWIQGTEQQPLQFRREAANQSSKPPLLAAMLPGVEFTNGKRLG
jgi:hypothetical protein